MGVLVGLSMLIFFLARVVPGDPVRLALGPLVPQEVVDRVSAEMHLRDPVYVQYVIWLGRSLRGDFGTSLYSGHPVMEDILKYLPATLELAIFAATMMTILGIWFGVVSVQFRNRWPDHIIRVVSYLGVATPSYVWAVVFVLVFGYLLNWMPGAGRLDGQLVPPPTVTGLLTVDSLLVGNFADFANALKHLLLPGTSLALSGLSQLSRIMRSSLIDQYGQQYVTVHRAYGIPTRRILYRYVLRPSLIPGVSLLGLTFVNLLSNAFLVEVVFNWPGVARYGMNAILRKDVNAVVAVVMLLGVAFVLVNIAVDAAIAMIDPRVSKGGGRS